jgi:ABC-2 type transport system ATP-binding protein
MIEAQGLSRRYGSRLAVQDMSFRVERGETVGFLGPNGAGKTTTLRMLTGYLAPNAGQIRVAGIDVLDDPIGARRHFGYMPEGVPVYPEMRVDEYLRYRAQLKRVTSPDAAVSRALEQAGVADSRTRIIGQLSKGYRQRVGLADALIADPPLLILDEPTSGLDPNQVRQVRALIRSFAGDKTVFLSSHILSEVEAVCDRVIIIREGHKVGEGTPADLRGGRGGPGLRLRARAEVADLRAVLDRVPGVSQLEVEPDGTMAVARMAISAGDETVAEVSTSLALANVAVLELKRDSVQLEDVFADLTAGAEQADVEDEL